MDPRFLFPFLEEQQVLSSEQSREISEELSRTGKPIETILANFGIIQMPQILEKISDSLGLPLVLDLSNLELSPELLARIPPHTARNVGALPLAADETTLTVALADPLATQALEDLRFATGAEISQVVAPPDKILPLIEKHYGAAEANIDDILTELENAPETTLTSEGVDLTEAGSAPIIKYVNTIIARAIQAKASDIHFEPFEKEFKIRYRVDGALYEMAPPPRRLAIPVTSRIKVMANLNIAERRVPQDGRIQTLLAGRQVDLRVSTLPTQYGESIVLRVLDRSVVNLDLEKLGIPKHIYDYICDTLEKPNGIFIVTGPTGSGKTTTLYSCLGRVNTIDTKILTVEDPVEYESGSRQDPGGRDAGPGNRTDRHSGQPDRTLGHDQSAHQRCRGSGHPASRHGGGAFPHRRLHGGRAGPTVAPQDLQGLPDPLPAQGGGSGADRFGRLRRGRPALLFRQGVRELQRNGLPRAGRNLRIAGYPRADPPVD